MTTKRSILLIYSLLLILIGNQTPAVCQEAISIVPVWNDVNGNPINAHGAGVLYYKGKYYLYGEYKKGKTYRVKNITTWECYRVDAGGVSCYSSTDLLHWKFEGLALSPEKNDPSSDIHISKVIERPKVVYNEKTGKFVMWMHIDSEDYSFACAGVAVSDQPQGPYSYIGSFRPNEQMSRDQTIFKDNDGKAYQICSSENNATLYINELTDDYLKPSGKFKRIMIGKSREAPAMVKHEGKYYLLSSACTGWDPNAAQCCFADSIMGNYTITGNPCIGPNSDMTYLAQSTFILPIEGKKDQYVALFDHWDKNNLENSRNLWLPLYFKEGQMVIEWKNTWLKH
jgi:beta-galactosidase